MKKTIVLNNKHKIFFLSISFLFFVVSISATAEESAPSHGGGGGGGAESAAGDSKSNDKPWLEVQNDISALRTKTKQLDDKLKELIQHKLHSGSSKELEKEIQTVYGELKTATNELRKQTQVYKFRFPERAAQKKERVYDVEEIPSLDKVEEQVGMDGKLSRNLLKMKSQYGEPKKLKQVKKDYKIKDQPKSSEENKTIRESDSPILRK